MKEEKTCRIDIRCTKKEKAHVKKMAKKKFKGNQTSYIISLIMRDSIISRK